jgi:small-conductance mechanosensitive channel
LYWHDVKILIVFPTHKKGVSMSRYLLINRLIVLAIFLSLIIAWQPVGAASSPASDTSANPETPAGDNSKDAGSDQLAVQFSPEEINAIAEALPDGEARQLFNQKVAKGEGLSDAAVDEESVRSGEEFAVLILDGEKAFSRAQERLVSFFTQPTSTIDTREWAAAFNNLNMGRGFGHLVLTLFIAALFIFLGLAVELLVRRSTENLRRQILDTASLGRLHFLGRVLSRLLLNLLGMGTYILTTFVLWAIFYDDGDPGFALISGVLLPSYYIRFFNLAANLVLSPAAPGLRLFPLPDEDAKFLFRWTIAIVVTSIVIADIAYLLQGQAIYEHAQGDGLSQESFLFLYSLSGLSVSLLMVAVIWQSRHRVARTIWSEDPTGKKAESSMRAKFARSWHWFAILYVIGMGVFWFIRGLAKGEIAFLSTLISVFLIPILIGISSWAERLLDIAAGVAPSEFISPEADISESLADFGEPPSEADDDLVADRKSYLQHHLHRIKIILRILLVALLFFVILRLWGIDLPLGRLFTSTALNIIGLLLLGIVVWQFTRTRIDRKIKEEMPDDDEEMEEGGSGGSRVGTLLVLLRKFVFSVLFVIVSLIILSSIGLDIGPLIAGAGVIGLAIGFGSQTLVRDILSGVFFLIDDAFRVGDYIETGGIKGMVEHISLRSVKLRHPRGMVFTIPFGDMGAVQNFSRDYIITKLDVRVRYDADVDKIRKIVKKINKELQKDEEIGPVLLSKIKSQGVREMDDSAMILRVKFKTPPGEQFVVRREVYKRIQERFRAEGIEFAHRNVTVYLPPEVTGETPAGVQADGTATGKASHKTLLEAGAAAASAATEAEEDKKKPQK